MNLTAAILSIGMMGATVGGIVSYSRSLEVAQESNAKTMVKTDLQSLFIKNVSCDLSVQANLAKYPNTDFCDGKTRLVILSKTGEQMVGPVQVGKKEESQKFVSLKEEIQIDATCSYDAGRVKLKLTRTGSVTGTGSVLNPTDNTDLAIYCEPQSSAAPSSCEDKIIDFETNSSNVDWENAIAWNDATFSALVNEDDDDDSLPSNPKSLNCEYYRSHGIEFQIGDKRNNSATVDYPTNQNCKNNPSGTANGSYTAVDTRFFAYLQRGPNVAMGDNPKTHKFSSNRGTYRCTQIFKNVTNVVTGPVTEGHYFLAGKRSGKNNRFMYLRVLYNTDCSDPTIPCSATYQASGSIRDIDEGETWEGIAYNKNDKAIGSVRIVGRADHKFDCKTTRWSIRVPSATGPIARIDFEGNKKSDRGFGLGFDTFNICKVVNTSQ